MATAIEFCSHQFLFLFFFCVVFRYGANPNPPDGGSSAVLALLDKLTENGRNYVYQNVSCLQILLRNIPMIELPYKVCMCNGE